MSNHINARRGDIAESVLLPGDPLRAKWIAETFLKDVQCYNEVRGMLGYTGIYKGKRMSVQGGGMGIPSTLIYAHELINEYGAKKLVRVGSAGSYQKDVKLRDIVIAMSASSNSGINSRIFDHKSYSPTASFTLLKKALDYADSAGISINAGNVFSSDSYYEDDTEHYRIWADYGVLCVEMESFGLYTIAAKYNVQALSILTISDSLVTGECMSSNEKERSFHEMVELALEIM